jgi:predicted small secreted protein
MALIFPHYRHRHVTQKTRHILFTLLACTTLLHGCAMIDNMQRGVQRDIQSNATKSSALSSDTSRVTINELNALTNAFADRYMTYMTDAADAISKDNPNPMQRKIANDVRLVQVSSIYDIVTNADPYTQLLDLTLVVTLQSRQWIDEDQAEQQFGARGRPLIDASRKAREDIWKIAARVMKPEQLETLDSMILDWRRRNREVQMISFVRFDDFAASRDKSMIADVKSGGGLLAPVDEAKKAVDEVRLLAERAFFLGKRMPFLMQWQVRSTIDETMTSSAMTQVTDSVPQIAKAIDRFPQDLARERQAIFADLRNSEPMVNNLFAKYRTAMADTNALTGNVRGITGDMNNLLKQISIASAALNETMTTVDKVFIAPGKNAPRDPKAKPFDINEYTQSAIQFTAALKEANQVLMQTGSLMQSPALMKPVNEAATAAADTSSKVLDAAFWRGLALIVAFFVMLTIYRFVTARMHVRNKPLV